MTTALLRFLRELQPSPAPLVATVIAVDDNMSTVEFPDGSRLRVRGAQVAIGQQAWVRAGLIEGIAPSGEYVTLEIG